MGTNKHNTHILERGKSIHENSFTMKMNSHQDNHLHDTGCMSYCDPADLKRLIEKNTSLKTLNLSGEHQKKQQMAFINKSRFLSSGNHIDSIGARELSEALTTNTTLTSLSLGSGHRKEIQTTKAWIEPCFSMAQNDR